ncbi:hypothetical protein AB0F03_03665 [Streptomyces sp. NPDC028722]|uniref:hypothetical protein n=1 Tax=Streptomyces sp. NPDC028722 TaxID=3155016 RepID=UPI00340798DC
MVRSHLPGLLAGAGRSLDPVVAALLHHTSSSAVVADSARPVKHTPHLPGESAPGLAPAPLREMRLR